MDFIDRKEISDDRAKFANSVCDLIIDNAGGNITEAVKTAKAFREFFEEHVRNVYELVDDQIPLFAILEMEKNGADNYGWTELEYQKNLVDAYAAAGKYHTTK